MQKDCLKDISTIFEMYGKEEAELSQRMENQFFKLHNAIKYEKIEEFALIMNRLIVTSNFSKKSQALEILHNLLSKKYQLPDRSLMLIILSSILKGYYGVKGDENEE